jgi:hypothetical protein
MRSEHEAMIVRIQFQEDSRSHSLFATVLRGWALGVLL